MALNVAKRNPELIKTLILEDASGLEALLPESPESQRLAAEALANREALAKAIAAGEIDRGVQAWFELAEWFRDVVAIGGGAKANHS